MLAAGAAARKSLAAKCQLTKLLFGAIDSTFNWK